MKESAERAKRSIVVIAAVLLLVATACGSAEPAAVADDTEVAAVVEDAEESAEATAPATSEAAGTVVPDTATPTTASPTTTEARAEDADREYPAFPVLEDPCSVPAEVGETTYSIFVEGQERPVLVSYNEASAAQEPQQLVMAFHGAGRGPSVAPTDLEPNRTFSGGGVLVIPYADDTSTPFWSASQTFNVAYLEVLYPALSGALCFDEADTVASGTGQGAFMVTEAICGTDIPLTVATMSLSFISFEECEPSRKVPIIALDVFEFRANLGGHWDGTWDPPGDYQLNRTGGIGPVPEDLDEWAAVYGCEGPRQEETIPDEGDLLERDSLLYSYPDCEASLHAFGFENGDVNPIAAGALEAAIPRLLEIIETLGAN